MFIGNNQSVAFFFVDFFSNFGVRFMLESRHEFTIFFPLYLLDHLKRIGISSFNIWLKPAVMLCGPAYLKIFISIYFPSVMITDHYG